MDRKTSKIVLHVDVAIKSYAISILTGSTFDGFIDCTSIKQERVFFTSRNSPTTGGPILVRSPLVRIPLVRILVL